MRLWVRVIPLVTTDCTSRWAIPLLITWGFGVAIQNQHIHTFISMAVCILWFIFMQSFILLMLCFCDNFFCFLVNYFSFFPFWGRYILMLLLECITTQMLKRIKNQGKLLAYFPQSTVFNLKLVTLALKNGLGLGSGWQGLVPTVKLSTLFIGNCLT